MGEDVRQGGQKTAKKSTIVTCPRIDAPAKSRVMPSGSAGPAESGVAAHPNRARPTAAGATMALSDGTTSVKTVAASFVHESEQ